MVDGLIQWTTMVRSNGSKYQDRRAVIKDECQGIIVQNHNMIVKYVCRMKRKLKISRGYLYKC